MEIRDVTKEIHQLEVQIPVTSKKSLNDLQEHKKSLVLSLNKSKSRYPSFCLHYKIPTYPCDSFKPRSSRFKPFIKRYLC